MVGIREKNKENNLNSILQCAEKLLLEKGYEETSIREIASLAGVGIGTVYNYFPTKTDIVTEIVARMSQEVFLKALERKDEIMEWDPKKGLIELCNIFFSPYAGIGKPLLRTIFGLCFIQQETMGDSLIKHDIEILDLMTDYIAGYQERKKISKKFPPDQLAIIIYSNFFMGLIQYSCIDMFTKEMIFELFRLRFEVIFSSWDFSEGEEPSKNVQAPEFIDDIRKFYNLPEKEKR